MRIKAKVKKMTGAEALRISLVGHAASRIPFRIVKSQKNSQENGMIDLSRIFKAEAKIEETEAPALIGVVVQKADASDALKESLIAKGFDVETVVENDDETVTYVKKGEAISEDMSIVRQSDDMLLVMKGFSSYSDSLTAFSDIANCRGFYAGVRSASDTLGEVIQNAMYKAAAPSDAAKEVGETIDAYKSYVLGLVNSLPTVAFKMEEALDEVNIQKSENEAGEQQAAITEEDTKAAVVDDSVKEPVQVEGEQQEAVVKAEDGEGKASVVEKTESVNVAEIAAEVAKILKGEFEAVNAAVEALAGDVNSVKSAQEVMQNDVKEVARKSETLEATLKGTVIAAPASEDQPGQTGVQKKEEFVPLGDTAFHQRHRNRN